MSERPTTSTIQFTRRKSAPGGHVSRDAGALVRPASHVAARRPWHPGRPATPEPVVWVSPEDFHEILQVSADPLVIREIRGWPVRRERYTTQYQGYYFTTRTTGGEFNLPPGATVIFAERVEFR